MNDLDMRAGCVGGSHIRGEASDCAYCQALRDMRATWPAMADDVLQPAADLLARAEALYANALAKGSE
jgi:hypothetical protein